MAKPHALVVGGTGMLREVALELSRLILRKAVYCSQFYLP